MGKAASIKSFKSSRSTGGDAPASLSADGEATLDETAVEELLPPEPGSETETGKFKQLLGILRKAINVKDLAAMRLSLPANLLEPIGNLEYWHYADRPDVFAAIPESEDELERMLAILRWTFTKDLKFVKHKIAKPYNSILGEHFHAHWDVQHPVVDPAGTGIKVHSYIDESPSPEVLAAAGRGSRGTASGTATPKSTPAAAAGISAEGITKSLSSVSLATTASSKSFHSTAEANTGGAQTPAEGGSSGLAAKNIQAAVSSNSTHRVIYITEQTSHRPPISHFWLESRPAVEGQGQGVIAIGADQLSAKFTGTTVKVYPGEHNKGIFVTLPGRDGEEYQVTHPTATVAGLLRAAPYATIAETTWITCRRPNGNPPGKKLLKAIVAYTEESWITKSKFLVEGVIYEYEQGDDEEKFARIKQVPKDKVVATFSGCWRGEVRYTLAGEKTSKQLIDLVPLNVVPKRISPTETQDKLETRRVWHDVSSALVKKDWPSATKAKREVEQKQRDEEEARKKENKKYEPVFFVDEDETGSEWDGRPILTEEGKAAVEREFVAKYADNYVSSAI